MGLQFHRDFYEPRWLAAQLRRWWNEPEIRESSTREERVRTLAAWAQDAQTHSPADWIAAKHPLLLLCADELAEAWGDSTHFVWSFRPLAESIASLERRGWWPGQERPLQQKLWEVANRFFPTRQHLRIDFARLLGNPPREVDRLIQYLGLHPSASQRTDAISFIRQRA
jgi:hypothetical protein